MTAKKSTTLILTGFVLVCALGAQADQQKTGKTTGGYAVSSSWPGGSGKDNNGRQLAIALPMVPNAATRSLGHPPVQKLSPAKANKPSQIDPVAQNCSLLANQLARTGVEKAKVVSVWLGAFFKQMNSAPVMTPFGGPYSGTALPYRSSKLWYMADGRLKTVVAR